MIKEIGMYKSEKKDEQADPKQKNAQSKVSINCLEPLNMKGLCCASI